MKESEPRLDSCCRLKPKESQQFLRDQASDREEVVTPLMLDGTYLSRNFATLGPMIRQPPCDYLFISFQRLSLLKIGPAKVPHRSYHLSPAFGKETLWKTTEKQLFYRCPKNFFLKEDTCEGRKLRLSRSLSRFETQDIKTQLLFNHYFYKDKRQKVEQKIGADKISKHKPELS